MEKLFTRKDLAERWQVSEATIDNWKREGILTPCEGIPSTRFSAEHIALLEGVKLEKFSPIERKRLEKELQSVKEERDFLKKIINNAFMEISKGVFKEINGMKMDLDKE